MQLQQSKLHWTGCVEDMKTSVMTIMNHEELLDKYVGGGYWLFIVSGDDDSGGMGMSFKKTILISLSTDEQIHKWTMNTNSLLRT